MARHHPESRSSLTNTTASSTALLAVPSPAKQQNPTQSGPQIWWPLRASQAVSQPCSTGLCNRALPHQTEPPAALQHHQKTTTSGMPRNTTDTTPKKHQKMASERASVQFGVFCNCPNKTLRNTLNRGLQQSLRNPVAWCPIPAEWAGMAYLFRTVFLLRCCAAQHSIRRITTP